jgi:hypothetical protein
VTEKPREAATYPDEEDEYPSLLGEPTPPKCDECASFDCENCPATYEEEEEGEDE